MDKKRRNKLLIALACMALVIGAFALITVAVTSTTMAEAETDADKEAEISSGTKNDASSDSSEKKAAEKLIDKTVSREKVKKNVGEWEKFEMSSDGWEFTPENSTIKILPFFPEPMIKEKRSISYQ